MTLLRTSPEALRGDGKRLIVADAYDAVRLESYGFPALATEGLIALTLAHLNGCQWVILLQRPGEEQTLAGIDVRGELLRLGWSGMLTSIVLPFVDLACRRAGVRRRALRAIPRQPPHQCLDPTVDW